MLVAAFECAPNALGVTDISRILGMSKSTASRSVAQLSGHEGNKPPFLVLEPHPDDRRRKVVRPSELLVELRNKNLQQTIAAFDLIDRIDLSEQEALYEFIDHQEIRSGNRRAG
ncbi:MAG: helix-turn-helix domain-containing protein [Pseudomonadales bacterium]